VKNNKEILLQTTTKKEKN